MRDYSVPMGEMEAWDRRRAAIVPMTLVISFFYLNGDLQADDDHSVIEQPDMIASLYAMIPGAIIGIIIIFKTKKSVAPMSLMTVYSILAFVMSVMWI